MTNARGGCKKVYLLACFSKCFISSTLGVCLSHAQRRLTFTLHWYISRPPSADPDCGCPPDRREGFRGSDCDRSAETLLPCNSVNGDHEVKVAVRSRAFSTALRDIASVPGCECARRGVTHWGLVRAKNLCGFGPLSEI